MDGGPLRIVEIIIGMLLLKAVCGLERGANARLSSIARRVKRLNKAISSEKEKIIAMVARMMCQTKQIMQIERAASRIEILLVGLKMEIMTMKREIMSIKKEIMTMKMSILMNILQKTGVMV